MHNSTTFMHPTPEEKELTAILERLGNDSGPAQYAEAALAYFRSTLYPGELTKALARIDELEREKAILNVGELEDNLAEATEALRAGGVVMSNHNLWHVIFFVNRDGLSYFWTEKFGECILKASSEDEAYKKALLALPKAIGLHKEQSGNDGPHLEDGEEKNCAVEVTSLDEFIAQRQARWEDVRTWEESPPF